jgi:REP element-mobilizing transposase RayT
MKYNPDDHHRRSIRLKGYDYSQAGVYFVTICTYQRLQLFGEIINSEMILNEAGSVAKQCWLAIPEHFSNVELKEFVIMPNHVHGIIQINVGANDIRPPYANVSNIDVSDMQQGECNSPLQSPKRLRGTSKTIGSMVRGFKTGVTQWFRVNTTTHSVWQRNYHEHIIRDENSYLKISSYVQTNPQQWLEDCFFEEVTTAAMGSF